MEPEAWLAEALPELDWSRVHLRRGLPWYLAWRRARAMVVPSFRRPGHVVVHLDAEPTSELLLHECYHALQYQRMGVPRFVARYVWLALRHGTGRGHPMEEPAYAFSLGEERP